MREQTAQLCEEMLQSINGCETGVHQKALNRLVRFIDQFKSINFANDQVMEQQLEASMLPVDQVSIAVLGSLRRDKNQVLAVVVADAGVILRLGSSVL